MSYEYDARYRVTPSADGSTDGFLEGTGEGGYRGAGGGKKAGVGLKGLEIRLRTSAAESYMGVDGGGCYVLYYGG